jgi:hypothetical protein
MPAWHRRLQNGPFFRTVRLFFVRNLKAKGGKFMSNKLGPRVRLRLLQAHAYIYVMKQFFFEIGFIFDFIYTLHILFLSHLKDRNKKKSKKKKIFFFFFFPVEKNNSQDRAWGPTCRPGAGGSKTDGFVELGSCFLQGIRGYATLWVLRPSPHLPPGSTPGCAHGFPACFRRSGAQWASMMAIGPTSSEVNLNIRQFAGATPR